MDSRGDSRTYPAATGVPHVRRPNGDSRSILPHRKAVAARPAVATHRLKGMGTTHPTSSSWLPLELYSWGPSMQQPLL
eukprot:jgi/Astpho2/2003/Aster-00508